MADVFDAVLDLARRTSDRQLSIDGQALYLASRTLRHEIDEVRRHRHSLRMGDTRRGDINMMPKFGEMHMLEVKACQLMCPALRHGESKASKEGWDWVAKQPWAEDFKPSPIEKRFY